MQWYPVEKEQTAEMIKKVIPEGMPSFFSEKTSDARCAKLPFYTSFLLFRLTNNASLPAFSMDFLSDGHQYFYLDGTSMPIYRVNATGDLVLNENNILDYLAFFVHYVPGPDGEILLIDAGRKPFPAGMLDIDRHREMLYTHRDIKIDFDSGTGVYKIVLPMYYGGTLVKAEIHLNQRGHLDICKCEMLMQTAENG